MPRLKGAEALKKLTEETRQDLKIRAETGTMILQAEVPLFRGAGRVAYETRYQAERELIYAVRIYERFRRAFLVRVADRFFIVQQARARIANSYQAYLSRQESWEKADFINQLGRSDTVFDSSRALSNFRSAEASFVLSAEV